MYVDLIRLNNDKKVEFDITPDLSAYKHDLLNDLENVRAKGVIIDNQESYNIIMDITGVMHLKSSIDLSDIERKIDIHYDDFIENLAEEYKKNTNLLDISPIIWENILLEIPIRAAGDKTFSTTSGDGWEIL